jgi:glycosyltransferase involved in cell wall biosynthesis
MGFSLFTFGDSTREAGASVNGPIPATQAMATATDFLLKPAPPRLAPLPRVLYAMLMRPGHKFGSMEEQVLTLAGRFRTEGSAFVPLFISGPGDGSVDFYRARGIDAEVLDLRRLRPGTLMRLLGILSRHRIDVIHWNFTSPLGNQYLWPLTLLRPTLRHYYTDHISRTLPIPPPARGPRRWLKQLMLRRYGRVFCVSEFVRDCLRGQGVWPEARLLPCLHFVNTDRFRPDSVERDRLRRELDAQDRFVVLVVGQLIAAKGIDLLIRALADLPPEALLWIVGDGPERGALDALIAERGLGARVRVLGHQFDVCPYLQAADCFVCPSRWAEAAGLVNLEAAACGLPVVASRIGGIPEYLDDGQTGVLFAPDDVRGLSDALNRLLRDRSWCRRLGAQARAMAVERFSTAARMPEILDLYRR